MAEIAQDRVGLEDLQRAINHRRDLPVGVDGEISGRHVLALIEGHMAYIHQHVFCARLDMELDGPNNTVLECNTIAKDIGPENPYGNAFYVEEAPLETELEARRDFDFSSMRYWKIINPNVQTWVGRPTGFKLEPSSPVRPFTNPNGPSGRRSGFIQHQLWVTPFSSEERYPAGEFVNQSTGDDGLPSWTAKDRPIANSDLVVWHSFGLHHLPRPEDHPVQSCIVCGFILMPSGFFDQNPVIDLPPQGNKGSCCQS